MNLKWELSGEVTIEVAYSAWTGKQQVTVNGQAIVEKGKYSEKKPARFKLADGRAAEFYVKQFVGSPVDYVLRVDGERQLPTPKGGLKCLSCEAPLSVEQAKCDACGAAAATMDERHRHDSMLQAKSAITVMAVMFALFGVVMFLLQRGEHDEALANLTGHPDEMVWPVLVNGVSMTVAELRSLIEWESWGILIINLGLAVVMLVLSLWAKRSPLPAMLTAGGIYVVVIAGNAIQDPTTLAQGILLKIFFFTMLYRGLQAALEARAASA